MAKDSVHLLLGLVKHEAEFKFLRETYYKTQETIVDLTKSVAEILNELTEQAFELLNKGQEEVVKALYLLSIEGNLSKADRLRILYIFDIYTTYSSDWEDFSTLVNEMKEQLEAIENELDKVLPTQVQLANMSLVESKLKVNGLKGFEQSLQDLKNFAVHLKYAVNQIKGSWKGQLAKCINLVVLFANDRKEPEPTSGA